MTTNTTLENICYSMIIDGSNDHTPMTTADAAVTIAEWIKEGGELAFEAEHVTVKRLADTYNYVLENLSGYTLRDELDRIKNALNELPTDTLVDVWNEAIERDPERFDITADYDERPLHIRRISEFDTEFAGCAPSDFIDIVEDIMYYDEYYWRDLNYNWKGCCLEYGWTHNSLPIDTGELISYIHETRYTFGCKEIADALNDTKGE